MIFLNLKVYEFWAFEFHQSILGLSDWVFWNLLEQPYIELGLQIWNMIFSYLLLFIGIAITKGKDHLFSTELINVLLERLYKLLLWRK